MKRVISIFLVLTQVFSISLMFSSTSYALKDSELIELDLYNKSKDELQDKANGTYIISDADILEYLNKIGGLPLESKSKKLNPNTFRNYKVVAYGLPFGDKFESYKLDPNTNTTEYRYLGYNRYGSIIANDQFANDFSTTSLATSRTYVKKDGVSDTWFTVGNDIAQKQKLLYENVLNDDIRENDYKLTNYSISSLLGSKINNYTSYVELMLEPTYLQEGVMRLWHKGSKSTYYDTMRSTPIDNMNISTDISAGKPFIEFKATDEGVEIIKISVKSNVDISPNYGQSESKFIKKITQIINSEDEGKSIDIFKNEKLSENRDLTSSDTTSSFNFEIPTASIKEGESKTFTFNAKTQVTTAYDNIFTSNTATIDIIASRGIYVAPSSADVDFKIFIDGVDYTDSTYKVKDLEFDTPLDITLKDISSLSNISPEFYYWYNKKSNEIIQAGDTSLNELKLSIDKTNKGDYLDSNNNLSFGLKIKASNGEFYDSLNHKLSLLHLPKPVVELPHSVLFAQTRTQQDFSSLTVEVGEKVDINGSRSFTKDSIAQIVGYNFDIEGFTIKSDQLKVKKGYFDRTGSYDQNLYVTDSKGQDSGLSEVRIRVVEPSFNLKISYTGELKENRKVTLDLKKSDIPYYYPLDKSSLKWSITPLDAGSYITNGIVNKDTIETQYLKKGRYKVKVEGNIKSLDPTNDVTYYSSDEIVLDIEEDQIPIVEFAVNKFKIRDAENENKVLVSIVDKSYSPDGDKLQGGILKYRYDSDDDGNYNDENEVLVSSDFNNSLDLLLEQNVVGKFRFYLERRERASTDVIRWFDDSYRKSNSDLTMMESEKILEILNVAPTVVFDVDSVKTIDYLVVTDYTGEDLLNLQSQLEKLSASLLSKKIKPNFVYTNPTVKIGTRIENKYKFAQMGRFTFDYDLSTESYYYTDKSSTHSFEFNSYELWESELNKLPAIKSYGVSFKRLADDSEYGDQYEKHYANYQLNALGKSINDRFSYRTYMDKYGRFRVYEAIRNERFSLDTSYTKTLLESVEKDLYSLDFDKLKTELGNFENPRLLLFQNNKYATGNLKDDFVDFMRENNISMYTNVSDMSNPTGIKEVEEVYNQYNSSKYYIKFKNGQIQMYDENLGMPIPVSSIPKNAIGANESINDFVQRTGSADIIFGNKYDYSLTTISSYSEDYALSKYNSHSYLNRLPRREEPYIIDNKLYIRNVKAYYGREYYWDYYNYLAIENIDFMLAEDCVEILYHEFSSVKINYNSLPAYKIVYINSKGEKKFLTYWTYRNDTKVAYNPYKEYYEGEYGEPLKIKDLNFQFNAVLDGLLLVDDSSKKAYDINGNFISDYVDRTDSYIIKNDGTKIYFGQTHTEGNEYNSLLSDISGKRNRYASTNYFGSTYPQSFSFIHEGHIYSTVDNGSYSYRIDVGPKWRDDQYSYESYFYSDRYHSNVDRLVNFYIGENEDYYLPFFISKDYYREDVYNYRFFNYEGAPFKKDFSSKFFEINPNKTILTNQDKVSLLTTFYSTGYVNSPGGEKVIISSVVPRVENSIDFSVLYTSNPSNKLINDISKLADTIDNDTETPYYEKKVYLLLGDSLESSMLYTDYENDEIKNMSFDFSHDPSVFENDLGRDPSSGTGLSKPINKFNYTGLYTGRLNVWDKPNLPSYSRKNEDNTELSIYVHRKPLAVASYKSKKSDQNSYQITLKGDQSYDLDHSSKVDKGIVQWQWTVQNKESLESKNYTGKEINIKKYNNEKLRVFLRVKDLEGQWSDYVFIDLDYINSMELDFNIRSSSDQFSILSIPISESIDIYDIRTLSDNPVDLEFYVEDGLGNREALFSRSSHEDSNNLKSGLILEELEEAMSISWQDENYTINNKFNDGVYSILLKAVDKTNPNIFIEKRANFNVNTPIDLRASVPNEIVSGENYMIEASASKYTDTINMKVYDRLGEKLMDLPMIYSSQTSNSRKVFKANVSADIFKLEGNIRFDFKATVDTEAPKSERLILNSKYVDLALVDVKVYGDWNRWDGKTDLRGRKLEYNPYRFLSFERIYIEARTRGNPDKLYLDLSDELKAMEYRDDKGNKYKYSDFTKYEVQFPLEFIKVEDNYWKIDYILPLADSTISIEDKRLREPYSLSVKAKKGISQAIYTIDKDSEEGGIEITGNIYDHFYIQKK